jgi:hypothetical protein
MKFMFARARTIASTMGHSIDFPKGELIHVPPSMYKEVLAAGGVPEDEVEIQKIEDDAAKSKVPVEPADPAERLSLITMAMEDMVKENLRDDFTANGHPHMRALKRRLGWAASDVERDEAWAALTDATKA